MWEVIKIVIESGLLLEFLLWLGVPGAATVVVVAKKVLTLKRGVEVAAHLLDRSPTGNDKIMKNAKEHKHGVVFERLMRGRL